MSHPWKRDQWLPGVLSKNQIQSLIKDNYIQLDYDFKKAAGYSAFDLHLSKVGYEMINGSIKPCGDNYRKILNDSKYAKRLRPNNKDLFKLETKHCYVFKLKAKINRKLDKTKIFGQATARSSIGRLDVIARLIVDGMEQYEFFNSEDIKKGNGNLYLEISPISFNIYVKEGISLSQLRLFLGDIEDSVINEKEFIRNVLFYDDTGSGYLSADTTNTIIGELEVSAFRANRTSKKGEFLKIWEEYKIDPCDYWHFVTSNSDNRLTIDIDEFYILRSKEKILLPAGVAVYCKAMDETLGEMRIHYAGFVHPFFGTTKENGPKPTPLIYEIRGHNVKVSLTHGERLAQLYFYRMSEIAKWDKDPSYTGQSLKLSNIFADWPNKLRWKDQRNGIVEEDKG